MQVTDPDEIARIEKEQAAAHAIERQIEFMKTYEDIGVHAPQWQGISVIGERLKERLPAGRVSLTIRTNGVEVYADPLLEKVFENLADNSLRHGERVRQVTISTQARDDGGIALVYEDDGVGIRNEDKERIFVKGFGKNTGLGMFLSREILAITDFSILENGAFGNGVRFEIRVPPGKHRVAPAP
jgi:signal transduction histidine kinase